LTRFLKFKWFAYGSLDLAKSSDVEMEIVGQFLDSDVGSGGMKFIKWFESDSDFTGGNLTYVSKYKDTVTIINSLTDDRITLKKEQFYHSGQRFTKHLPKNFW
jgi:hypothetical protein